MQRFLQMLAGPLWPRDHRALVSLEDHELDVQPFRNTPSSVTHVLILRHPQNLFASRIRKAFLIDHPAYPRHAGKLLNNQIKLWKSHAREFLGETKRLPNLTGVYFDRWFVDQEYRAAVSHQLGLEFTDAGISEVSQEGGGSSFDGTHFDGRSESMDVLNRRDHLDTKEQELLETILSDPELADLRRRLEAACTSSTPKNGTVIPAKAGTS